MKLKDLKNGDYFTLKPIAYPKENQVFVKDEYDRRSKRYLCYRYSDVCDYRELKGDKEVFTDFIF